MATNKHAVIRYHALDMCFSNRGRKYFIEDLINACNDAIYEYTGKSDGVKKRQVQADIKFMESDQGWSIPLERIKEGRRVYYRYYEKDYSIKQQAINESELNQLQETLSILTRFKGMPQFDWMDELLFRLESTFKFKHNVETIVDFEQNPFVEGLDFFTELFNAIYYKRVLKISYQGFNQKQAIEIPLHPYYLKQYNNRWFLFGLNEDTNSISNLALDRIIAVKEKSSNYIENETINFEEYFDDVIGVTVHEDQKPLKVLLHVSKNLFPYIKSKPIHGSQITKEINDKGATIELSVMLNYEFIALIFSYGEELTVIAPEELKTKIKMKAQKVLENYF